LNTNYDFYENYIKNINAVTAEDIKNAANKYFLTENTRVVITGKAADVLPALEKLSKEAKLPIFYFDKFGNPAEKPVVKKEIPAGVTAQSVIQKHIDNIGGADALKKVKTVAIISSGTVQGTPLTMTTKMTKGKIFNEISAMGMSFMKTVVNEKSGYAIIQGQKQDITGETLKDMQSSANPVKELDLLTDKNITLKGIETIKDTDAYAIESGNTTYYFDVKSGYKIAESSEAEQMGQKMKQITYFEDYKEVKGLKFPYKTTMNMGMDIEFITSEVKINEGVTDADFN
ncbi:MAG: insulinase family protein, partial [Flavobacterium sp.]|nr:insulinase family protein [Flavobacterium sp.]